ncbi:LamG domain-containing protein, partial [Robiginitalea sp.]|nr:LamG domain-containing protein [Robiginitalea sp.]
TGAVSRVGGSTPAYIDFNSFNWAFSSNTSGKNYDNQWHQYVFVYDAGVARRIYIDGSLVAQNNDSQLRFGIINKGLSVGAGRYSSSGTFEGVGSNTYTGSVDDVRIWNVALTGSEVSSLYTFDNNASNDFTSPPTAISGITELCGGASTTLTASGGVSNTGDVDIWYDQANAEAFSEGWDLQPYTTADTSLNSISTGVLSVTSTSADPMIDMFNLGSFDPNTFTHINFRYRVTSGVAEMAQIFFLNGSMTVASDTQYKNVSLVSDNAWHTASIDMSSHARWTADGDITGWRYDYTTASGVTMEIDFITLATGQIIGTGASVTVSPTTNSTYYVQRKGPEANTSYASQLVTVSTVPTPTFTAEPGATSSLNTDVTYTTQSGQTNYVWTLPGTLDTDYSITSGGASSDNSLTLKWLTSGSKTVSVSYTNLGGCSAVSPSSSTINVENPPPTYGAFETISRPYFSGTYTITPPTTNNTSPFVYESDNTAVATISGDVITFTGIGTATITASQVADANYDNGSVSATLTVVGKNVASRFGGVSQTDVNYVSPNGKIGGNYGVNKYGKRENVKDAIVTSGLVLYLDAGNPSSYPGSGTTWSDLSGNGNHGALTGGVTYSTSDGGALVFDGDNDYFETDANIDLTGTDEVTIQVLVKTTTIQTQMIAEHSVDWNANNAFGMAIEVNKVLFTDHNQGYNASYSVTSINDNEWHLLTGTIDRSLGSSDQSQVYVDGEDANKTTKSNLLTDNNGNFLSHKFYVGSRAGSTYFFDGIIAQVLLYDRALTVEEIQQ